ncbi:MAG: hypothetical protein BGO49_20385 [Planctomycetales bacterium 71-10]|nr:MAG: hypothetical protein BGO49_20385 [Planctomycetales bacterium 71-10]
MCCGQGASCECEGDYRIPAIWAGDWPEVKTETGGYSYNVHQWLGDTRIARANHGSGEYPSFAEAKAAAVDYLDDLISLCGDKLDQIQEADTYEDYAGGELPGSEDTGDWSGRLLAKSGDSGPPVMRSSATRERVRIHWVTDSGWLHTHGMDSLGLPELEIRDVPGFLAEDAGRLLRHVCDYMADSGARIKSGETMATSPRTRLKFVKPEPMPGVEDHYTAERLLIVDVEPVCECCRAKPSDARH